MRCGLCFLYSAFRPFWLLTSPNRAQGMAVLPGSERGTGRRSSGAAGRRLPERQRKAVRSRVSPGVRTAVGAPRPARLGPCLWRAREDAGGPLLPRGPSRLFGDGESSETLRRGRQASCRAESRCFSFFPAAVEDVPDAPGSPVVPRSFRCGCSRSRRDRPGSGTHPLPLTPRVLRPRLAPPADSELCPFPPAAGEARGTPADSIHEPHRSQPGAAAAPRALPMFRG